MSLIDALHYGYLLTIKQMMFEHIDPRPFIIAMRHTLSKEERSSIALWLMRYHHNHDTITDSYKYIWDICIITLIFKISHPGLTKGIIYNIPKSSGMINIDNYKQLNTMIDSIRSDLIIYRDDDTTPPYISTYNIRTKPYIADNEVIPT
jgi:hypothetical protein